jgi:hypothetical protein
MAYNQQLSVFGQVAPATTGTAGQVLVSAGSSESSYWASTIPVSAYSAQFSGAVGNYLSAGTSSTLALGAGNFTIECWVYPTAWNVNTSVIWDYRTNGGAATNVPIMALSAAGVPTLSFSPGSAVTITGSTALTLNAWNHLALARSGTSVVLYLNGVSIGTATSSATFGIQTLAIGNPISGATNYSQAGFISNFRIVKGVAVYTGAFTTPTSPLGTSQAAGTNISAVTPSQVSLLTCNGPGFTDSSPNAFTITNNGTVIASQFAPFTSFSAIARSATQTQTVLTSGSGTYYPPSGVAWLRIRMVGAGGGGAGGGGSGTDGSVGASTTFGASFLVAGGGSNGVKNNGPGGAGGTSSIASGATGASISGGSGEGGGYGVYAKGGDGGSSAFGGSGLGGRHGATINSGTAGATNSGAGGGGGNINNASADSAGSGGGAGGYVEAYISSPAASYAYSVGAAGAGGAGGGQGAAGGGGGSGIIIVEENYAVNVSGAGSNITRGTAVATTSGTAIDFTNIPSWVKRITVMFSGVSTSGSSQILVQVGAGSTTTTGYTTVGVGFASTPTYSLAAATTTGFIFQDGMAAFVVVSGAMYISSFGSNLWVSNAVVNRGTNGATSYAGFGAGNVTLSGTLDRVRLTTVNGTDTFDAGSVNILYE